LRNATAFSPDGTLLVTPLLNTPADVCGLRLWKVPSLEPVENVFPDELASWSAAFHPDGRYLLIGTFYGELMVWDLQKRAIVQKFEENHSAINTIAVATGAKVFATTSLDHGVSLWDAGTFKVLARFRGHRHSVWASALSPDGKLVATASFDDTSRRASAILAGISSARHTPPSRSQPNLPSAGISFIGPMRFLATSPPESWDGPTERSNFTISPLVSAAPRGAPTRIPSPSPASRPMGRASRRET
jgi:WD40 repeat protein